MVSLEPADLSNQEKKSCQSDAGRKERADTRKADQQARKAKTKATSSSCGIAFIKEITSTDYSTVYFPSGLMTGFIGASYSFAD